MAFVITDPASRICYSSTIIFSQIMMNKLHPLSYYILTKNVFDTVPYKHLSIKLKAHGMGNQLYSWIDNWLSNWKQPV